MFPQCEYRAPLRRESARETGIRGDAPALARLLLKEQSELKPILLEGPPMLDVLFVVVTIGFFAITLAYTAACERL
jgi:hypothetical protein